MAAAPLARPARFEMAAAKFADYAQGLPRFVADEER
jgi:hypothetical protein